MSTGSGATINIKANWGPVAEQLEKAERNFTAFALKFNRKMQGALGGGGSGGAGVGAGLVGGLVGGLVTTGINAAANMVLGIVDTIKGIVVNTITSLIDLWQKGAEILAKTETAQAKLQAAIVSTGNRSEMTYGEIIEFAQQMAKDSQFAQYSFIAASSNLVRLGGFGKSMFKDILRVTENFAVVFGKTLEDSSNVIGRALARPDQGSRVLRRFLPQKAVDAERISDLAKSGNMQEARKALIETMVKAWGGAADAAANTISGLKARMEREWAGVAAVIAETFGGKDAVKAYYQAWIMLAELMKTTVSVVKEVAESFLRMIGIDVTGWTDDVQMAMIDIGDAIQQGVAYMGAAAKLLVPMIWQAIKTMIPGGALLPGGADSKEAVRTIQNLAVQIAKINIRSEEQRAKIRKAREAEEAGKTAIPGEMPETEATGHAMTGQFEGLQDLYKRIAQASASDPVVDAVAKVADNVAGADVNNVAALDKINATLINTNAILSGAPGVEAAGALENA